MSDLMIKDQLGSSLRFSTPPVRVVSLVPSLTETLILYGNSIEIVGRTKFCIHPSSTVEHIPVIGGTKNIKVESILDLQPDVVIASKEENIQAKVESLKSDVPVYVSDIKTIDDLIQVLDEWQKLWPGSSFSSLAEQVLKLESEYSPCRIDRNEAFYLIWENPRMTVGCDTFIHCMMEKAGFHNLAGNLERYPVLKEGELKMMNPAFILLSSEPYPYKEEHLAQYRSDFPESEILLVDGEMFSWYGHKTTLAWEYFNKLLPPNS